MSKNVKIIIAIVVIAMLAAGIGIPLAIWGDDLGAGVSAVLSNQNIYTLAQVQEAQQAAYDELEDVRKENKLIIADYERQLKEKEADWTKRYNDMVAIKDGEIQELRDALEGARGYGNAMENYLLGAFSLLYDSFDSPELNNYLLKAFYQMQTDTQTALDDYKLKLSQIEDVELLSDALNSKITNKQFVLQELADMDNEKRYVEMLNMVNNLDIRIEYQDYYHNYSVYFTNPSDGQEYEVAYAYIGATTESTVGFPAGLPYLDVSTYENFEILMNFLTNSAIKNGFVYTSGFSYLTSGYSQEITYPLDIYDFEIGRTLIMLIFSRLNGVKYVVDVENPDEALLYVDYSQFAAQGEVYKTELNLKTAQIAQLDADILNLNSRIDKAIYDKGYYTSLKTQAEGALAKIQEKIDKLISEGATLNE